MKMRILLIIACCVIPALAQDAASIADPAAKFECVFAGGYFLESPAIARMARYTFPTSLIRAQAACRPGTCGDMIRRPAPQKYFDLPAECPTASYSMRGAT